MRVALRGRWGQDGGKEGFSPWLFTAIQSGFQSFSLFQDGAIQILEVSGCSGRQGQCFRTDSQSFRMVQDGFQDFQGGSLVPVYFQSRLN